MHRKQREVKAEAIRLLAQGNGVRAVAAMVGVHPSTIIRWRRASVAFRADGRAENGRRPTIPRLDDAEMSAVRAMALRLNRTRHAGSVRAAVLMAARQGLLRPHIASAVLARDAAGLKPLAREQLRALRAPEPLVRALRTSREAAWTYCSADGALPLLLDSCTPSRPGEVWTADDATINFAAVVNIERPGDPCWDRYGVMVGRFQVILVVDHRSYFVPAFIHTARPHQQYRAEDVLAALGAAFRAHGLPRGVILERGISAANQITESLDALGVVVRRARTPHTKVAEWIFHKLWTLLSHHPGQLGRSPGDDDRMQRIYQRCRRGELDPRQYFLPLADVISALHEAIKAHNEGVVHSRRYGSWCPAEWWQREAPAALRPLDADMQWALAPVRLGPVKVNGMMVRSTIRLMDTHSTLVTYAAPELADWHGARVYLWTDPWQEGMPATVTLAEDWRGHRRGLVICRAEQIDAWARYTRRHLLLGQDPDIGAAVVSRCRHVLRRRALAISAGGDIAMDTEDIRLADGSAARIRRGPGVGQADRRPHPRAARIRPEPDPLEAYLRANPMAREILQEIEGEDGTCARKPTC